MKKVSLIMAGVFTFMSAATISVAQDKGADGQKIFVGNKCTMCHTVSAEKIEATGKKSTDLSAVGSTHKADFLQKYLKKEEQVNGKKHPAAFKGTDADLKTLSTWLAGLKKK